ncbi:hypothetical protein [Caballeronia sp. GACF4]|uniref:hypothetical protein n=1 Tax=Caballeronia sp. GACF4 TaxID=2921763 RepID=UPI002028DEC8|nr:hypothetical protein [Caballeronia sp. GACF4]
MPVLKKRQRSSESRTVQSRRKKQLYLPLKQPESDQLCLQARLSFQAMREGRGDRATVMNMASISLMCEMITAAGHGLLPLPLIQQARKGAFDALDTGAMSGVWAFTDALINQFTLVINEYDRQMRETRLHAIIAASEKVEHLVAKQGQRRNEECPSEIRED